MAVAFNHTIVHAHDREASATFFSEMMGLAAPYEFGPFLCVDVAHGASFDFFGPTESFEPQHYAFLVSEDEFDQIYGRIVDRNLQHWAGPHGDGEGEINHHWGGRGVYWRDPGDNLLEILTVPYGGWRETPE